MTVQPGGVPQRPRLLLVLAVAAMLAVGSAVAVIFLLAADDGSGDTPTVVTDPPITAPPVTAPPTTEDAAG